MLRMPARRRPSGYLAAGALDVEQRFVAAYKHVVATASKGILQNEPVGKAAEIDRGISLEHTHEGDKQLAKAALLHVFAHAYFIGASIHEAITVE